MAEGGQGWAAKADTWRTRFGGAAKQTQGGHMADASKADTGRTNGGHMADTRRTQGGHMADKLRERGQSIARQVFFLRENPAVNCLGNKCYVYLNMYIYIYRVPYV